MNKTITTILTVLCLVAALLFFFSDEAVFQPTPVVGQHYKLCCCEIGNPFNSMADVIVEEVKDGYVKYCWASEYKLDGHVSFSRSFERFWDLTNTCK